MSGYHNYSMSNNAVLAYQTGEKPLSKWTKSAILETLQANNYSSNFIQEVKKYPAAVVKSALLYRSSWHHTSKHYNETDFYSVDVDMDEKEALEQLNYNAERLTAEKAEKQKEQPERWLVHYGVWVGTRRHPKCEWVEDIGTISGNWFVSEKDGTRKNVNGNYFEKIKKI